LVDHVSTRYYLGQRTGSTAQLVDLESIMSTEPTRARVVAYVRVFADKQASDGLSIAIIATKVDAGASVKSLDRRALQEALALLRSGEATALLVVKLDRLTGRRRQQPRPACRRWRGRGARARVGARGGVQ
jgi:resolvase-like protein